MSKHLPEHGPVGRLLTQKRIPQREMAEWLGVSKSEASRIARGYIPDPDKQQILVDRLKTSKTKLFPHRNGGSK